MPLLRRNFGDPKIVFAEGSTLVHLGIREDRVPGQHAGPLDASSGGRGSCSRSDVVFDVSSERNDDDVHDDDDDDYDD